MNTTISAAQKLLNEHEMYRKHLELLIEMANRLSNDPASIEYQIGQTNEGLPSLEVLSNHKWERLIEFVPNRPEFQVAITALTKQYLEETMVYDRERMAEIEKTLSDGLKTEKAS